MSPFIYYQRETIIITPNGNSYIVGDAQVQIEGLIKQEQVFGVIHKVIRKGKTIQKGNF